MLEDKLGIINQLELNGIEERISKEKAKQLYDFGDIDRVEVRILKGLSCIHNYLFEDIYEFVGKVRSQGISKGDFRFAPVMYLEVALEHVGKMPQKSLDEIVAKYVEMNITHPFREGNGKTTRVWLGLTLKKKLKQVVGWNLANKEDYLFTMERNPVSDLKIEYLISNSLTNKINDREISMKDIDVSYYYEGYTEYNIEDL